MPLELVPGARSPPRGGAVPVNSSALFEPLSKGAEDPAGSGSGEAESSGPAVVEVAAVACCACWRKVSKKGIVRRPLLTATKEMMDSLSGGVSLYYWVSVRNCVANERSSVVKTDGEHQSRVLA